MTSISKLPCEIKENIFSWIRFRDLYEVSVVSEEWWWLTLKTYKGILSEEDALIRNLLDFYNQVKDLSTPLMWFNLVKYCNFSTVKSEDMPRSVVLEYFLESRKPIRSLGIGTKYEGLPTGENPTITAAINPKLEDLLKYFPHLEKLELQDFYVVPSSLKIPKGIKRVYIAGNEAYGVAWSSLFEDPESIQSLELNIYGMTIDHCAFKNLKTLSLQFETLIDVHQMKNILDLIRGHKFLRSVKLVGVKITKEWFNLFGKSIENICLKCIHIEEHLLTELGTDGCFERRVMLFVCIDFRTLRRFHLAYLSADFDEGLEEHTDIDYHGYYTCRPKLMEEKLHLELYSRLSRQVQTITTTVDGPVLRDLHIECRGVKTELLTNCVPASVKKFKIRLDGHLVDPSFTQLCQLPQNLEDLNLDSPGVTNGLSIQRDCFVSCTQLKVLEITQINREGIQNLLQHCVCLERLTLTKPETDCFTDLSPVFVCKTIREVNLHSSDARLEDVLCHFPNLEVLRLFWHRVRPLSIPTAFAKLKLFSAMFFGRPFSDFRSNYGKFAFLLDAVEVPCKLFYSRSEKYLFSFHLGCNDLIIEEFEQSTGFAYCCGIPTRYLKSRGIKILGDVKHFSDF